jgi:hypothetical protein
MTKLIPPKSNTIVVRYGNFWNHHKWHILRPNSSEIGICGVVCIDPVTDMLDNIKGKDLCKTCYPYERT